MKDQYWGYLFIGWLALVAILVTILLVNMGYVFGDDTNEDSYWCDERFYYNACQRLAMEKCLEVFKNEEEVCYGLQER